MGLKVSMSKETTPPSNAEPRVPSKKPLKVIGDPESLKLRKKPKSIPVSPKHHISVGIITILLEQNSNKIE